MMRAPPDLIEVFAQEGMKSGPLGTLVQACLQLCCSSIAGSCLYQHKIAQESNKVEAKVAGGWGM